MKNEKITNLNRHYLSDESLLEGDADSIVFCENTEDIKTAVSEAAEKGFCITVQGARTGITGGAVPLGITDIRHPGSVSNINEKYAGNTENAGSSGSSHKTVFYPSSKIFAGSLVLNLSKMKQVYSIRKDKSGFLFKTGPGITLTEIENILKDEPFDISLLDKASLENLRKLKKSRYFFPPDPTEKSASIGGIAANCASGSRTFHYGSSRNYINSIEAVFCRFFICCF